MDRLSILQKTLITLILATMTMLVVLPLTFFFTISLSSAIDMTEFPKRLFPKGTVTVYVEPTDDGKYELFYDYGKGEGYTSIITTGVASRLETHFQRQYSVSVSGEQLLQDFSSTRTEGAKEFTYRKDPFYNFKTIFPYYPKCPSCVEK